MFFSLYFIADIDVINVGVFACICGGASLQRSLSTNHVEWLGGSFGMYFIEDILRLITSFM